jgi:hypothetical protein
MDPKEKIKYFNQRFLTLVNKIPEDSRLPGNVIIEIYTSTLPSSIVIFVKREKNTTLVDVFQETLEVELEIISVVNKTPTEEKRVFQPTRKLLWLKLLMKKRTKILLIWMVFIE